MPEFFVFAALQWFRRRFLISEQRGRRLRVTEYEIVGNGNAAITTLDKAQS